jgi:hypothetical protein
LVFYDGGSQVACHCQRNLAFHLRFSNRAGWEDKAAAAGDEHLPPAWTCGGVDQRLGWRRKGALTMLSDLTLRDDCLSVVISGSGAADFDYFWLRDNARDPISFDSRSHQRELFTCEVDADIKPCRGSACG